MDESIINKLNEDNAVNKKEISDLKAEAQELKIKLDVITKDQTKQSVVNEKIFNKIDGVNNKIDNMQTSLDKIEIFIENVKNQPSAELNKFKWVVISSIGTLLTTGLIAGIGLLITKIFSK